MKKRLLSLLLVIALMFSGCTPGATVPTEPNSTESDSKEPGSSEEDSSYPGESDTGSDEPESTETDKDTGTDEPGSSEQGSSEPEPDSDKPGSSEPDSSEPEPSEPSGCKNHKDANADDFCDVCNKYLIVYVDFYGINDLHGKFVDGSSHPGVDELTTYLKNMRAKDDYAFFLSAGDMWQGSAESNMTKGMIMTEWMNELDFVGMALGNHEYDWGEEYIKANAELAEFPFLAINIYDRDTNQLVDYCQPSVVVEAGDIQIGIIGAMGDCYSSIATDKSEGVYFKVKNELTELVKAESERLRSQGVDCIVYVIHDGYGQSSSGNTVSSSQIKSYYDVQLSNGYVDLVFEGHTHQGYALQDEYGVYHMQHRGDNNGGISHVELKVNSVTSKVSVSVARLVTTGTYSNLNDDPIVNQLLEKYKDQIDPAYDVLGYNSVYRGYEALHQLVADMYYDAGVKKWGNQYDVVLGGGFISVRSPYKMPVGDVKYELLQTLYPFDNDVVLCSIKGSDLLSYFINSKNEHYYTKYASGLKEAIAANPNGTYYIITDTYTSTYKYAPKSLKEIARYDTGVYARDLVADYIKNGGLK